MRKSKDVVGKVAEDHRYIAVQWPRAALERAGQPLGIRQALGEMRMPAQVSARNYRQSQTPCTTRRAQEFTPRLSKGIERYTLIPAE